MCDLTKTAQLLAVFHNAKITSVILSRRLRMPIKQRRRKAIIKKHIWHEEEKFNFMSWVSNSGQLSLILQDTGKGYMNGK